MILSNVFRYPAWVGLSVLFLLSGCNDPGASEPTDAGQDVTVAPPIEEVPAPVPDEPEEPPASDPAGGLEPSEEPSEPASEPSAEDLTADLDDFFGTANSSEGSPPDEEMTASTQPAPSGAGSAFGDFIAGEEPAEPEAEQAPPQSEPVLPGTQDAQANTPASPVDQEFSFSDPPPAVKPEKPIEESKPAFDDLFPPLEPLEEQPLEQPEQPVDSVPKREPKPSEQILGSTDEPPPTHVIPEWSPNRPAEQSDDLPAVEAEPEMPVEHLSKPASSQINALPFSSEPTIPAGQPAETLDDLPLPTEKPQADFEMPAAPPTLTTSPPPPRKPKRPTLDVNNTRHLAWMLGAKLSLMAAPEAGAKEWEVDALAEMLGVPTPELELGDDQARNVTRLLQAAAATGDQVAKKLSPQHAALLEIAVKSNSLAALYERYPKLGPPVAAAIRKASDRAGIDAELCRPLLQLLRGEPTAEQVREAVFSLHSMMDQALRE